MPTRREVLLDAAIDLLGEGGVKGVTHRAVDAAAGVAAGSTANYFSTRQALFEAVVARFSERERHIVDDAAATICPTTPAELGRALAASVRAATGPHRTLTLARYAILVEAGHNAPVRGQLGATGARVNTWFATWLRLVGSTDPDRDVHLVGNYLTGLVLHQLAIPDPDFDPSDKIILLLESLIDGGPGQNHTAPS